MKRTAVVALILVTMAFGMTASANAASSPTVVVKTSGIVSVEKSGFSAKVTDPEFGSADAQFGLTLHDTSSRLAALGVRVTVTFSGKGAGTGWVPSSVLLTGIPAGGNFYFGGVASGNPKPTTMKVVISVERTSAAHLVLPPVTRSTITSSLLPHAVITVKDPYSHKAMFGEAVGGTIYVVYFGSHGQFVGSDQLSTSQLGFPAAGTSQTYSATTAAPLNAVKVQASVDPCSGGTTLDTTCIAFQ